MIVILILNGKIQQLTQVFTTIAKNRRRGNSRRNGGSGGRREEVSLLFIEVIRLALHVMQ